MPDLLPEIACAAQAHYDQAGRMALTAIDFYAWLAFLAAPRRAQVLKRGLTAGQSEPALWRFCLEQRGYSMWTFMAEHLSKAAFARWADGLQGNGDALALPPLGLVVPNRTGLF